MNDGITVYGAATCEDTAITRSRLEALGVPYRYVDIDEDPAGAAEATRLSGRRVTPTIVREAAGVVADHDAEPSIERVDAFARAAGASVEPPGGEQLHGAVISRAVPIRTLEAAGGGTFSLAERRGRRAAALFFGHPVDCLACFGYAKQLARQAADLDEVDADPIVVVPGGVAEAAGWLHELPAGTVTLADPDGAWRREVGQAIDRPADGVLLVLVDRFAAPRVAAAAAEAGGLVAPAEATSWLRFVALDCPECSGEIAWPE
ncbi:MAG TPA: glutaredoxin family protein [Candidatus Limnocylindrales bacterium]|nr:glutaredoxin family protein [Candidatus Limnocylindrales bacterium]